MTDFLTNRYRRWFEYEKDSDAKVLVSLKAVTEELQSSERFQKAVDLMAHIVTARSLWLYRLGISKQSAELFPQHVALADLPARINEMEVAWSAYLNGLKDEELTRVFDYQSYEGPRFRSSVEDILTQLFGHSWYHRGQVAMLLRSIGAEPAVTDFIFWTREPVAERSGP
jgi:uncharacterized damage-inducible protein DinB